MLNKILKIVEANAKISSLNEKVKAYQDKLTYAQEDLDCSEEFRSRLQGELADRDIEIKSLNDLLAQAKEENKAIQNKSLDATAQAAEIVASIGISEPIQVEDKKSKSNDELLDDFTAMTDPAEKMQFYKKHREQLLNLNKEN